LISRLSIDAATSDFCALTSLRHAKVTGHASYPARTTSLSATPRVYISHRARISRFGHALERSRAAAEAAPRRVDDTMPVSSFGLQQGAQPAYGLVYHGYSIYASP